MANTTNLNMVKPAGTDHALISVINSNMDIIDGAVGALPSGTTLQGEIDSANTAIGTLNSNVTNMATRLATKAFTTNGSTGGGQTTMTITLPESALFDNVHSLFIICSIRQATGHGDDGYAALKLNSGTVVAMQKMVMTNCTNFAYDATTRNLTFTAPSYMTCCVFGMASS